MPATHGPPRSWPPIGGRPCASTAARRDLSVGLAPSQAVRGADAQRLLGSLPRDLLRGAGSGRHRPMGGLDDTSHHQRPIAGGRIRLAQEPAIRLGALIIEPGLRRVARDDGREEIVEPRVMQVLVVLIRSAGGIITRDDLLMSCWNGVV